jgi:type I restriction enzyme S subunit
MLCNMEVVQDYIQTEIGLLPSDWEIKTLGDLALVVGGGTPQTNVNSYWNGNINWFTPTEVGLKKYSYSSIRKITIQGLENCSARILPIGTILLTTRAGIGDVTILMSEASTNQGFQSFVANKNTNNEYLYYLISTLKKELLKNSSGSTFLEISPNKLKSIVVGVPSTLEEQTIIATAISNADTWITNLEKLLTKKRQIKQGALQELLKPKKGWEVKKLGEVGECIIGLTYSPDNVTTEGKLVLRSSNVKDNKLVYSDTVFVNVEVSEKLITRKGDILICVRNGSRNLIGKCAFIDGRGVGETFGAFMSVFRSNYNAYIFQVFQSNIIKKQIEEHLGATINQITNKSLNSFQIPFPTIKEQEFIVDVLSDMDAEIEQLETKLEKAKKVKQGMMQELLTGKTRLV